MKPSPPTAPTGPAVPSTWRTPWIEYGLRPLVLTIMVGCLAWPLAHVIRLIVPGAHGELVIIACLLAAIESNYSYNLIRERYISGSELWRFRAIEFGALFFALRGLSLLLAGWPAGTALVDAQSILVFLLDFQTVLAWLLALGIAYAVNDTLADLDRVDEPPEQGMPYTSPLDSLTSRFFIGGLIVMVLSALARVPFGELLDLQRAPAAGLVLNVLVYFMLGLLLLGRLRLALLTTQWQAQGMRVAPELPGRWVRYTIAFVGLAALLAFALPTGYTRGALGVLGAALELILLVVWLLMSIVLGVLVLPIAWLMSRLFGAGGATEPAAVPRLPPVPTNLQQMPAWLDALRPFLLWGLVAAMVGYVLYSYLRERPELMAALRRLGPLRALRRMWAALWHRVSGLAAVVERHSPLTWLRERLRRARPARPGYFRLGGASPREQVMYYYLSVLRRARDLGFGRQPPQTPREYRPVLESRLPEAAPDLEALTAAFVEVRYSAHPLEPGQAAGVRSVYERVRNALREYRQRERDNETRKGR